MEGGSSSGISLDSGLDINTSDMLVPIGNPTFQHNWQRYQGKFLPNSMRFEKNGWAAGWNVYNFVYSNSRIELGDGVWAQYGKLSSFAGLVTIFDDKNSTKARKQFKVIPNSTVIAGNVKLNGNTITGNLNGKDYSITWDEATETFTMDTVGFSISQKKNANESYTVTVSDDEISFSIDIDLFLSSPVEGRCINSVRYDDFDGTSHSWGKYSYNKNTGVMSTPEGVTTTPTLTDNNLLSFNYDVSVKDETLNVSFTLEKYYPRFLFITCKDNSNEKMTIGQTPSEQFKFNFYEAQLLTRNGGFNWPAAFGALLPDEDTVGGSELFINWRLPVWVSGGFEIAMPEMEAYKCNNVKHNEIAISVGTGIRTKVQWINSYGIDDETTSYDGTQELADNYRLKNDLSVQQNFVQYITNMMYRFNQILVGNTIEPSEGWSPLRYTINPALIWYKSSRQYKNLREKKVSDMRRLLGDIYTYGNFTFKALDYFEKNDPYDWSDRDNCVYTRADISEILSIKLKGAATNTNTGDDLDFVDANLPIDMSIIATLTGATTAYVATQAYQMFGDLYTNGIYTGGTYVNETVSNDEYDFWPFARVPKFNLKIPAVDPYTGAAMTDSFGNIIYDEVDGVYWTDGRTYIDDFYTFREKVLGEFNTEIDPQNNCLVANADYNRVRLVKQYKAVYDFEFKSPNDFVSMDAYNVWKDDFDLAWTKWYLMYSSPQGNFSPYTTMDDNTYLDFNEIQLKYNVDPEIKFVVPGVYVGGANVFAAPFNAESGLVIYVDHGLASLVSYVFEHTYDVSSNYNGNHYHNRGKLTFYATVNGSTSNYSENLPYYFEPVNSQVVYASTGTTSMFKITTANGKLTRSKIGTIFTGKNSDYEWLKRIDVYYDGKANWTGLEENALHERVDKTSKGIYVCGDLNSGVNFGFALWGNSATRLKYPTMRKVTNINDSDAFVLEKVPNNELNKYFDNDRIRVFWDRDHDEGGTRAARLLFEVAENGRQPDAGNGTGNFTLKLVNINSTYSCLWYAQQQQDFMSGSEFKKDYYIPGIVFGDRTDKSDATGNLNTITEDYPILKIEWVPETWEIPEQAVASFSAKNSIGTAHVFYGETGDKNIIKPEVLLGPFDADNMIKPITVVVNGVSVEFNYDVLQQKPVYTPKDITLLDAEFDKVVSKNVTGDKYNAYVELDLTLYFHDLTARFYHTNDANTSVVFANGSVVHLKKGGIVLQYDALAQTAISPRAFVKVTQGENMQHLFAQGTSEDVFTVAMSNVNGDLFTFEYMGKEYTVDLTEFKEDESGIKIVSTNITEPSKTKTIGYINDAGQYQLIKQQWNSTVEVENFWWIDSTHILELNSSQLVLKRKTDELDDWDGDRFVKVYEVLRSDILPTAVLRHFVTNVYASEQSALFVTLQIEGEQVTAKIYNIREKFELFDEIHILLKCKNIGSKLNDITFAANDAYFNTYNNLVISQLLSKAKWSNTITDNRLIIGCHISNNIDQWAIVYNLKTKVIEKCIQGYGYVGLHGDLTGGQVPDDYFDENVGFNGVVEPLSTLSMLEARDLNDLDAAYEVGDVDRINNIDTKVVGTSEQQWYIRNKLFGIVSHLTYAGNGEFVKQIIPMTNNYASTYKSPSFSSSVLADNMIQAVGFSTMFQFDGALGDVFKVIMGLLGYPLLFSLAPRFGQLAYLQQTFGQYAYVHYNSSKHHPDSKEYENSTTDSGINSNKNKQTDPVLSSDFTFDKQKFSQSANCTIETETNIICGILVSFASAVVETTNEKLSLNEEQNQSAVSDTGKKFLDNVVDNVSDMLSTNIATKSRGNSALTCVVTGLKSLDMFYSTSDQQRVFAGPGFVEHQFVADCVAQSSTSIQVEGKLYQMYWCIGGLTIYQLELTMLLEEYAIENLQRMAEALKTGAVFGSTFGPAASTALLAVALAMQLALAAQKTALNFIKKVLDVIESRGITSTLDGTVSRHALSVEGKHKYGEKNEVFMWPCWGVIPGQLKYTDEWVECGIKNTPWYLNLDTAKYWTMAATKLISMIPMNYTIPKYSSTKGQVSDFFTVGFGGAITTNNKDDVGQKGDIYRASQMRGLVPYYQAACYGNSEERSLPDGMAKVEGVNVFLPKQPFKNENIGVTEPAFAPSMQQDYVIDEDWDLAMYCTYGDWQWVTVKDTKITDCAASNLVVKDDFCGIACPYMAVEVKRGLSKDYMRPWAITPNTLALNCTGYNTILDNKLYHSFDGITYRIVDIVGSPGMNKNNQSFFYSFQVNDRFKRSNIVPVNELQGNFESEPVQAIDCIDELFTLMTISAKQKGGEGGTIGEDKDAVRFSIPVFTEHVSTLPAAIKTLTAMQLLVDGGVTCLVIADISNNQVFYKAPLSVDFTIGKKVYRATEEYICSVESEGGYDIVTELVPSLGLKFIGATPTEAYLYSKSTRCYYTFTGSTLVKVDMMERFRDIQKGYWDFVNQEVVMPCLMTYKRLNEEVLDTDTETDNIIVPVLSKNTVSGELPPPITTIFNDRSWYKCLSLPSGFAYQGPNRVIINRSVFVEYMLESMKENLGKWKRMDREKYVTKRQYGEEYFDVVTDVEGVDGWTHNPFLLVTSPLGTSEDSDCIFEWNITFCWPIEMELIYGVDNYAVVNIMAETMTPGGKQKSRPTHVFLTKELFTRNGNYGYYSFRFQSKNGKGNRERLHIWSDQYIAISSIFCESKVISSRRNEQLTQQIDVQRLTEL